MIECLHSWKLNPQGASSCWNQCLNQSWLITSLCVRQQPPTLPFDPCNSAHVTCSCSPVHGPLWCYCVPDLRTQHLLLVLHFPATWHRARSVQMLPVKASSSLAALLAGPWALCSPACAAPAIPETNPEPPQSCPPLQTHRYTCIVGTCWRISRTSNMNTNKYVGMYRTAYPFDGYFIFSNCVCCLIVSYQTFSGNEIWL